MYLKVPVRTTRANAKVQFKKCPEQRQNTLIVLSCEVLFYGIIYLLKSKRLRACTNLKN